MSVPMPPDRHALLFKAFQGMDADKSDYVDAMEFKSIFSDATERHSDARLAEIDSISGRGETDGRLTATEFCEYMLEMMADKSDKAFLEEIEVWMERIATSKRKLLLRRVFARMDTDKSGSVSLEEFRQLADEDVGASNSEAFYRWIENASGNGDGQLTVEEWVPFVLNVEEHTEDDEFQAMVDNWFDILAKKRRITLLRQVFQKMDADCTGDVDILEFKALAEGSDEDQFLPDVFNYLDGMGNADGLLTMNEWVDGMRELGESLTDEVFEAEVAKWQRMLSTNQRAIWRGCFARGHASSLVTALRAVGATHVLLVHHGAAAAVEVAATGAPPPLGDWADADAERRLTNQGAAQCMVARDEWFGRLPVCDVLMASPSACVKQTAMQMAGRVSSSGVEDTSKPLVLIDSLHPHGVEPTAEELFAKKGFLPLIDYLEAEGGETAFGTYAEAVCCELAAKFRSHGKKRDTAT